MRRLLLACVLVLGGCSMSYTPACGDAGAAVGDDASQLEPIDGHPITCVINCDAGVAPIDAGPETIESEDACPMIESRLDECGTDGDFGCPFAGTCNAQRVAFCVELVQEQGDNCVNVRAIIESPECSEACE